MVLSKKYTHKFLEMSLYTPPLKISKIRFKGGVYRGNWADMIMRSSVKAVFCFEAKQAKLLKRRFKKFELRFH